MHTSMISNIVKWRDGVSFEDFIKTSAYDPVGKDRDVNVDEKARSIGRYGPPTRIKKAGLLAGFATSSAMTSPIPLFG